MEYGSRLMRLYLLSWLDFGMHAVCREANHLLLISQYNSKAGACAISLSLTLYNKVTSKCDIDRLLPWVCYIGLLFLGTEIPSSFFLFHFSA